ncbi:MAG: carbohydrate ABC transporter permease [Eubacteriales bacterium]|nr:carbohydrate ABC transporter permease [Eubacteriales bacterium]
MLNYGFFLLFSFLCFYPLWYVIVYTISDPAQAATGVTFWPKGFSLFNFREVLKLDGVFHAFGVSIFRTVVGTLGTVLCCTVLGYLFSKERMPARKFFYRFLIITMYISGGMIPTYLVFRSYKILNTFWVYFLPSLISAYNVILVKTYVEQLPAALEESALLDGANVIHIIVYLIIPLSLPIIATIAIYAAVGQWNAWFDNHIYAFRNDNLTTLQYMLYNFLQEAEELAELIESTSETIDESAYITPTGVKMTVTLVTILPIMCVYPFLQRFFIKGIMIGAVKG